ncbi:integrase catalytic domain-containing protein [Trichonephila clavata]|uniref:Integrase catalytic domain-containing protein n=1 Tax=Trichonephila clavata TaxID=2740835 RepID=A0A8X6KIC9_TRICU|nr:integrase catalytic domain-containing protein [Trichonephila clavata]
MTSSETGITLLDRKRGNIKCQLTKMANALQKQTDLSIPELQAKLDVVLKLQDKFELLKNDYYGIANDTKYAEAEPSLNSLEDDLQDFEQKHHTLLHKYSTPSTNYKTDLETLGPDLNSSQILSHSEPDSSSENARVSFHTNGNNSILINTAIVYVRDSEGIRQPLRAILDCASESSFISSKSAEALGLQKEKDFYMDDCLSGSSELTEFETLQMELKQLLQRGGMTLHKWCTNLSPTNSKEFPLDRNSEEIQVKTLGMIWNSKITAATPNSLRTSSTVTDQCYTNELKPMPKVTLKLNIDSNFIDNFLDRTNNFHKLIRILAFILRFIKNCKPGVKQTLALTLEEYGLAEIFLIKHFQAGYFSTEIASLKKGSSVLPSSKLRFLNPFIDREGLLRVGGRISHSNVSWNQKHPIILPAGNKLVKLIFQYYHKRDFHLGQQALLNTVRLKYWPLGGRSIARRVVHECVECFKNNPVIANQIMGDLPPERITPSSAFQNAGLDLCGPFLIKYKGQRKGTDGNVRVVDVRTPRGNYTGDLFQKFVFCQ